MPKMDAATPQKRKMPNKPASLLNLFSDSDDDYFTGCFDYKSDLQPELPNTKNYVPIMDAASSPKRKKPDMVPASLFDQMFSDLDDDFTKSFDNSDLQRKYLLGDAIGEGTEGVVHKAIHQKVFFSLNVNCITSHSCIIPLCVLTTQTKETVAIKRVEKKYGALPQTPARQTEASILQSLEHANICKLRESIDTSQHQFMVIVFFPAQFPPFNV